MDAPDLPARNTVITLDMSDYGAGPGQWSHTWGTADPTSYLAGEEAIPYHVNAVGCNYTVRDTGTPPISYDTTPPDVGDPYYLTGYGVTMDATWQAALPGYDPVQYTDYIQLNFVYGPDWTPMKVSSVKIGMQGGNYWNSSYWTTPPVTASVYDVLWTPLDRNGASAGPSLSFYSDLGGTSGVATRTGNCYGVILDHRNPGYDNPAGWFVYYIQITVGDNATYLRQRQSPVRSPSRVSWKAY